MLNLAVDIGNTNVKMAVFDKNELKGICIEADRVDEFLNTYKIGRAILSSTSDNHHWEHQLRERKIPLTILSPQLKFPVEVLYKTPETLGPDRIAGSIAAAAAFPDNAVLKIDFGTCVTFDFVNEKKQYLGGAISPGMMMRFKALHTYTAKLPLVDPMAMTSFELIGTDTVSSMAIGVINGIKNEVSGIISEYKLRSDSLKVVATGGDMGLFVTLIKSEIFARPYLVLEGLNVILNFNK